LQDTNPLNKRPHRHAENLKDIFDEVVQEILVSGFIQNSYSSYVKSCCVSWKKMSMLIIGSLARVQFKTGFQFL